MKNPLEEKNAKHEIPCGCPGSAMRHVNPDESGKNDKSIRSSSKTAASKSPRQESSLRQWPVQLNLLPPYADFFRDSELLVCADCVPFANPNFHSDLLKGKSVCIGCPKLDDVDAYKEKLTEIFTQNNIKKVTVAIMEVPCCYGLYAAVEEAVKDSGKKIIIEKKVTSVSGKME